MRLLLATCCLLSSFLGHPVRGGSSPDDQVSRCGAEVEAYRQVLTETNPPEVVEISIDNLLSSLRTVHV